MKSVLSILQNLNSILETGHIGRKIKERKGNPKNKHSLHILALFVLVAFMTALPGNTEIFVAASEVTILNRIIYVFGDLTAIVVCTC